MERAGFSSFDVWSATGATRDRASGLALAIALHVAVLAWLLRLEDVRQPLAELAPIMVSLIVPAKVEVARPPEPPRPKPAPKPQPVKQAAAPTPIVAAPADAAPAPVEPAPVAAAPAPAPPASAPAGAAPPPVVAPRFNADYLRNPAPPYPPVARRMGEQGRVVLRVLVSTEGLPETVELRSSSGSPRLDQSALETVKRWKFVPARQGDRPIAAWVLVPIKFSLEG